MPAVTALSHVYCCDPDTGLCGTTLTGVTYDPDDDPMCVVCDDLTAAQVPCRADCWVTQARTDTQEQP